MNSWFVVVKKVEDNPLALHFHFMLVGSHVEVLALSLLLAASIDSIIFGNIESLSLFRNVRGDG